MRDTFMDDPILWALEEQRARLIKKRNDDADRSIRREKIARLREEIRALGEEPCA